MATLMLKLRRTFATFSENSLLAKHHVLYNHEIDLENVIALPSVYKNINRFQRH